MIPLERWLRNPGGASAPAMAEEGASSNGSDDAMAEGLAWVEAADGGARRVQELEEALAEARDKLTAQQAEAALREAELAARLGAELAAGIGHEVAAGLRSLQEDIESAVTGILQPFLGRHAALRASAELAGLVGKSLGASHEPLLDVRAPIDLHEALHAELRGRGLEVQMTEAAAVELVFTRRRERFELLAAHWIGIITEHEG
ncbi:hypothetical protein [Aestuariivirga sp.]|uniref:hypothetical protein n=1 Tax=Aestuariivirga sp. TaxID=2650926 RepID=UPI0025C55047|nr:hypothetical protein [Aestuariivirga sp.]MCA3554247.1 hypothetical protein [Aestuariivirga sp.]